VRSRPRSLRRTILIAVRLGAIGCIALRYCLRSRDNAYVQIRMAFEPGRPRKPNDDQLTGPLSGLCWFRGAMLSHRAAQTHSGAYVSASLGYDIPERLIKITCLRIPTRQSIKTTALAASRIHGALGTTIARNCCDIDGRVAFGHSCERPAFWRNRYKAVMVAAMTKPSTTMTQTGALRKNAGTASRAETTRTTTTVRSALRLPRDAGTSAPKWHVLHCRWVVAGRLAHDGCGRGWPVVGSLGGRFHVRGCNWCLAGASESSRPGRGSRPATRLGWRTRRRAGRR
jgi:hypothetical protein